MSRRHFKCDQRININGDFVWGLDLWWLLVSQSIAPIMDVDTYIFPFVSAMISHVIYDNQIPTVSMSTVSNYILVFYRNRNSFIIFFNRNMVFSCQLFPSPTHCDCPYSSLPSNCNHKLIKKFHNILAKYGFISVSVCSGV